MRRLIDTDKLTKQMDEDFAESIKNGTDTLAFAEARNFLLNVLVKQDIVDAVEVVRCKDCKYCDWDNEEPNAIVCLLNHSGWYRPEHFCSCGERNE